MFGVGFHHAGVDTSDRSYVENLFTEGALPVLVSTSTLAMGVNLPAHLVIIKSTSQYVSGEYKEYSAAQVLQMVGRAGRPQFDESATAVIMTKLETKAKYESLLLGKDVLESHLHKHLVEHLNAEIVLGTIQDLSVAVEWLRSTYFYIRVQKNPQFYRLPIGLTTKQLESKLQEMCTREVNALASVNLITLTDVEMKSTLSGKLMARYCISFTTMKTFINMKGDESLKGMLELVSKCHEFADIKIRSHEKKTLNEVNKVACRFPIKGRIKTAAQKVNCLIQATLRCQHIGDYGLTQEVTKIMRIGRRLSKCLFEYSFSRHEYELVLNATILSKVFSCQIWESSSLVSKQLERIGPTLATSLSNAKFNSFNTIENADPRELELICNRQPPFGTKIKEQVQKLPEYELAVQQIGKASTDIAQISVTVRLANYKLLSDGKTTTDPNHSSLLLLGDRSNCILYAQRITDKSLFQSEGLIMKEIKIDRSPEGDEVFINFMSETWAGLDVQNTYTPRYLTPPIQNEILMSPSKKDYEVNTKPKKNQRVRNPKPVTKKEILGSKGNDLKQYFQDIEVSDNSKQIETPESDKKRAEHESPTVKRLKCTNSSVKASLNRFKFVNAKPKLQLFNNVKSANLFVGGDQTVFKEDFGPNTFIPTKENSKIGENKDFVISNNDQASNFQKEHETTSSIGEVKKDVVLSKKPINLLSESLKNKQRHQRNRTDIEKASVPHMENEETSRGPSLNLFYQTVKNPYQRNQNLPISKNPLRGLFPVPGVSAYPSEFQFPTKAPEDRSKINTHFTNENVNPFNAYAASDTRVSSLKRKEFTVMRSLPEHHSTQTPFVQNLNSVSTSRGLKLSNSTRSIGSTKFPLIFSPERRRKGLELISETNSLCSKLFSQEKTTSNEILNLYNAHQSQSRPEALNTSYSLDRGNFDPSFPSAISRFPRNVEVSGNSYLSGIRESTSAVSSDKENSNFLNISSNRLHTTQLHEEDGRAPLANFPCTSDNERKLKGILKPSRERAHKPSVMDIFDGII